MTIPGVLAGASVGNRWSPEHDAALSRRSLTGRRLRSPGRRRRDRSAARRRRPITPDDIRPMIPLGQFRDTFIIAVDDEGVAIIDQHVAHERVLFEQMMERLTAGRLESQRLLTPILLDLSPAQRQALAAASRRRSSGSGWRSRSSAATACASRRVPALLDPAECEATVRALAEDLDGLDARAPVEEALRRIAATMACHAAVKANYPLTLDKMRYILDELRRTAYSSVCPHGRPVVLRLTRREIEKNFQRI